MTSSVSVKQVHVHLIESYATNLFLKHVLVFFTQKKKFAQPVHEDGLPSRRVDAHVLIDMIAQITENGFIAIFTKLSW